MFHHEVKPETREHMDEAKQEALYGQTACPKYNGKPAEVNFKNCPCVLVDDCLAQGIIPLCVKCANAMTCSLRFVRSCGLFGDTQ